MLQYIVRRTIGFIPLILAVSIITFVLIELPPGTFSPPTSNASKRPPTPSCRPPSCTT